VVSGQQHAPTALYPWESPGTHFIGGWVDPRDGLDGRKISSIPDRPAIKKNRIGKLRDLMSI